MESLVGVVTAVTSDITGAVVSVVVVVLSVVVFSASSSLAQEKMVRLIMDMRIICKIFFHLFPLPVTRGYKFEKSHIQTLESETLSK